MNWKNLTLKVMIAIVIIVIAILIYDAVAIMNGGTEASISSIIINASYSQPSLVMFVSWFIGLLQGHLFWRMKPNKDTIANGIDKIEHKD